MILYQHETTTVRGTVMTRRIILFEKFVYESKYNGKRVYLL